MGYDNKGAWTDLINGVDYVDAKDINNLAHKEQELEAIVKEKAYKIARKIVAIYNIFRFNVFIFLPFFYEN